LTNFLIPDSFPLSNKRIKGKLEDKRKKTDKGEKMEKAKIGDIEIAYCVHGEGEPLILIGGFTMVKESWGLQVKGLSNSFMVITFDNRGVGDTKYPPGPFTISDMAGDTVALMNFLKIDSAHIFGVSMGGLIAQMIALDYPDRVRKLILGCTTHGGRHAVQPEKETMELLASASDPMISPERAVRMRAPILFSERFIKEEPERLEEFLQLSIKYWPTPEGAQRQIGALSVFNVKKRLGEIKCPVLVITGKEDRMMPPVNSKLLAEAIPGARLYMVEGAGHSFFLEKPEEVNRIIMDFLKN
jgi:pimeloyl-ACP methyl ester carboxylesterase